MSSATDTLGRHLRDLRISVTDRCNFRCTYCMPREVFGPDHAFVERSELLTFEEIVRVARAFAGRGVRTLRLTGGEPLLRRDLPRLVTMLANIDGIEELAMTTNGALLRPASRPLAAAGLRRVTVSLDALDPDVFASMADTPIPVAQVLDGLEAADAAGLHPIKVNAVVRRGVNEDQIVPLARMGRERGYTVRFIEYMDVGTTNGWAGADVVPAAEIAAVVDAAFPIDATAPSKAGETALRYRYRDGAGEIGIIASVTQPFSAPAPGHASRRLARSSHACSPEGALTYGACCVPAPMTPHCCRSSTASGAAEVTAIRNCAPRRARDRPARASRCPTSAGSSRNCYVRRRIRPSSSQRRKSSLSVAIQCRPPIGPESPDWWCHRVWFGLSMKE